MNPLILISIILYVLQIECWILTMATEEFNNRREALLWLIPGVPLVLMVIEKFKYLKR